MCPLELQYALHTYQNLRIVKLLRTYYFDIYIELLGVGITPSVYGNIGKKRPVSKIRHNNEDSSSICAKTYFHI